MPWNWKNWNWLKFKPIIFLFIFFIISVIKIFNMYKLFWESFLQTHLILERLIFLTHLLDTKVSIFEPCTVQRWAGTQQDMKAWHLGWPKGGVRAASDRTRILRRGVDIPSSHLQENTRQVSPPLPGIAPTTTRRIKALFSWYYSFSIPRGFFIHDVWPWS